MKLIHFAGLTLVLFAGCAPAKTEEGAALDRVVLQTDWFPQPEHGGFYQALAMGYYAEAGLEVELLPGGPNAMTTQQILRGRAHFAMNRADTVYGLTRQGVEAKFVMSTLQHDPQAVMLHAENPVESLEQLDGKRVMAIPGLMWVRWIQRKYGIELTILPHDFGMERFLNDKMFIQQCLVTNEPFFIRQHGIEPKVLMLRESGFDPYHGIYCLADFAEENPELVERFVAASIRGWADFILGDPAPAFAEIARRNPRMTEPFMRYSWQTMRDMYLVTGMNAGKEGIGTIDPDRMEAMVRELEELDLIEGDGSTAAADWYTTRFVKAAHGGQAQ